MQLPQNGVVELMTPPVNQTSKVGTNIAGTTGIVNQISQLHLVDTVPGTSVPALNNNTLPGTSVHRLKTDTLPGTSVNLLKTDMCKPGTSGTDLEKQTVLYLDENNEILQVPVEVLSNFAQNTSEVYVLSVELEQDSTGTSEIKEDVAKSIQILDDDLDNIEDLKEPQRSSTPKFDETGILNMNDTILDGNLRKEMISSETTTRATPEKDFRMPLELAPITVESIPSTSEDRTPKPALVEKDNRRPDKMIIDKEDTSSVKLKNIFAVANTTEKKKQNVHHQGIQKYPSINGKCVADWIAPKSTRTENTTHNKTYCRDWVSQNIGENGLNGEKAVQNDSLAEQDSCQSSLLDNVTSVSNWVKPKALENKSQGSKHVEKKSEKDKM